MRILLMCTAAALCVTANLSLAVDAGHDGAVVGVYTENLRTFLQRNAVETIALPDFEWFKNSSWNILATEGRFGDLTTVRWADRATIIENGDVTNVLTSLYVPHANLHYKITAFQVISLTVDVKVITNALKLDVNFNRTDCSVSYNQIEVYYFENVYPQVQLGFLDNPLVPRSYKETVESAIAVSIQITNSIFNIVIRPILTAYVSQTLTSQTPKFNLCQIFKL